MEIIDLFLIDMSQAANTSGVDRYIGTLLRGLKSCPSIRVCWIHFIYDKTILFPREEQFDTYIKLTIPLPQQFHEIINERFWIRKYNEQVYRIVAPLFANKNKCIVHLHTLNLIDLAVYLREQIGCKIVTHLHCIPWKGTYNHDKCKFNMLYKQYLDDLSVLKVDNFVTQDCELQSYIKADHVICVTQCAVDFLRRVVGRSLGDTSVIPNGIDDFLLGCSTRSPMDSSTFKLLYVGVLSESKGLLYIIEALKKVRRRGYNVSLTIAGSGMPFLEQKIKEVSYGLPIRMLGRISFDELVKHYRESDAGVIASLQEQSSYVAIEMAMFGLPVITTAVDGLDEMFTDEVNVLKVQTRFSSVIGLSVDIDKMVEQIIRLIVESKLRELLSENIRMLYEQKLTLRRMVEQTVTVYKKVIGGKDDA